MDIGAIAPLFDPSEAERIVQELAPVGILELGTTKWVAGNKWPSVCRLSLGRVLQLRLHCCIWRIAALCTN